MKSLLRLIVALLVIVGGSTLFVKYYSFIFARKVTGVIESIERIDLNVSLLAQTDQTWNPQIFSFAVAVKEPSGEIVTSSAEDRQWAVVQKGQCVEAVFYPYPPWNVMKSGTYFNARLDRLTDCSK